MPSSSANSTSIGGHDRQPSVQLKIEASGGPPNQTNSKRLRQLILRNGTYFVSQIAVLVTKLSPIVQIVSIVLILLYLIQLSGDSVTDWLILSPDSVLSVGQWYRVLLSLFTHPFIELHFYTIVIDMISLSLLATLIEPLWGPKEVILFFWVVAIGSAFLSCLHYILIYTITTDASQLFSTRIHGLSPFCASIAVTVKQMLSQSVLLTTAVGKLKNDDIPLTSLLVALVLYFLNLIEGESVVMFFYGLLVSWIYLRFFQLHEHNSRRSTTASTAGPTRSQTRGDYSDAFAFHTFFPNVLRPVVAVFADALYALFVRIGLCPDISAGDHYQAVRLLSERLTNDMNHTNHTTNHTPKVETL
ncbi:unnamed protein product [Oppiella nova]|uniref:Transmembrane protein 115 n=1 Tax=Oppiella nova TaxID=334625 RepID=A0A7R9QQ39_9ACAR|nr:unnamed protein product [Oppiella nova]CAG2170202.1 unnamed protein product [Oppiella nova]